jgi:ComF family protein
MLRVLASGIYQSTPSVCEVCGAWPAAPVCEACVRLFAKLSQRCSTCAGLLPNTIKQCRACVARPPLWSRACAAVDYEYPWNTLIAKFKFQEDSGWARFFARLMRGIPSIESALQSADVIIPMPLSAERLKQRGFNQAALLARNLSEKKTLEHALLRVINTVPQSSLPYKDRGANVRNAFSMEPLNYGAVSGKKVVLVDDVMTSGASLTAATQVLMQAGAAQVMVVVFARTRKSSKPQLTE